MSAHTPQSPQSASATSTAAATGGTRLQGRTAIVTGAARGIGLAIAQAFVREGARVILTDIDHHTGEREARALQAPFLPLDVRSEAQWEAVTESVTASFGALDILVNNAGITGFEPANGEANARHDPEHATLASWQAVLHANLDGVFLGCKAALRTMRRIRPRDGAIVNIGSRSGLVGIPRAAAYAASKAAIRNHTRTVALYAAEEGLPVRCNVVHPAMILTPMWDPMLGHGDERDARIAALVHDTPLRRPGYPAEVAAMVVFLASSESTYVTGAEFVIDGGLLAGSAASPRVLEHHESAE